MWAAPSALVSKDFLILPAQDNARLSTFMGSGGDYNRCHQRWHKDINHCQLQRIMRSNLALSSVVASQLLESARADSIRVIGVPDYDGDLTSLNSCCLLCMLQVIGGRIGYVRTVQTAYYYLRNVVCMHTYGPVRSLDIRLRVTYDVRMNELCEGIGTDVRCCRTYTAVLKIQCFAIDGIPSLQSFSTTCFIAS